VTVSVKQAQVVEGIVGVVAVAVMHLQHVLCHEAQSTVCAAAALSFEQPCDSTWFGRGAALRALRQLLDEKDPGQHWGGLKKVLTPEGHYLWLCEYHAEEYTR